MTEEERKECPPLLQPAGCFSMNPPKVRTNSKRLCSWRPHFAVPARPSVISASAASRIRSQVLFKCKCFQPSAFGLFAPGTHSFLLRSRQLSCYQESIRISALQDCWDTDWVLRTQFERRGQANHKRRNLLQGTADGELEWHLLFSAIDSTLCHIVPFEVVQFPRLSLLKMTDVQTPRTKGSKKWFESDSVLAGLGDRLEEEVLNPAGKNWCLTMTMTMMQ